MNWEVEYTDEFDQWWSGLTEEEQVSLAASVQLLEERGPSLGYPPQQRHQWLISQLVTVCMTSTWNNSERKER